jgi:hypothetical protein
MIENAPVRESKNVRSLELELNVYLLLPLPATMTTMIAIVADVGMIMRKRLRR